MKPYKTIALVGVVFALTIGMLGANGLLATPFVIANTATSTINGDTPLKGHVTLVVSDTEGKIKAYRQMDNLVVSVGETCTGSRLFGDDTTTPKCSGGLFDFIAIGTSTQAEATGDTALLAQILTRQQDTTKVLNNSTGTGATSVIATTFTATGNAAVAESGLFDASSGNHMFARKLISPVVNVVSGDQLTITWTITTGS